MKKKLSENRPGNVRRQDETSTPLWYKEKLIGIYSDAYTNDYVTKSVEQALQDLTGADAPSSKQQTAIAKQKFLVHEIEQKFGRKSPQYRKAKDKLDELKREIHCILPYGVLIDENGSRIDDNITGDSGIMFHDVDGVYDREELERKIALVKERWPYGFYIKRSLSGFGFHLLSLSNARRDQQRATWEKMRGELEFVVEHPVDKTTYNFSRLLYASRDPRAWLNLDGLKVYEAVSETPPKQRPELGNVTEGLKARARWAIEESERPIYGDWESYRENRFKIAIECPSETHNLRKNPNHAVVFLNPSGRLEATCFADECKGSKKLRNLNILLNQLMAQSGSGDGMDWAEALDKGAVTSAALRKMELRPRPKLLGEWMAEGDLGMIFADRGTGKTWMGVGVAEALSKGDKFGEWKAPQAVKVLYIDGEMPPDMMRERMEGLELRPNENLTIINHDILFELTSKVVNITYPDIQDAITNKCLRDGFKVLILDNLSTLASGMKENDADSWEKVNAWLLSLRRHRITVIIIHHAGRSGFMRGTTRREDNVFWIIKLEDYKKTAGTEDERRGAHFISRFDKPSRNTQENVPAYRWHFVTNKTTGEVSIGCYPADDLDVLRKLIEDGVNKCSDIAEEMHVSKGTVSKWAARAARAGWLRTNAQREYEIISNDAQIDGNAPM